jgi:hypothetical protein
MYMPDLWLRERFWERVWKGPGAVATYLSLPLPLLSAGLAHWLQPQLEGPSFWILATHILLGAGLTSVDAIWAARNHHLQLLRLSAEKSRARIEKVGIKSESVDRFVDAIWLNAELELSFRKARFPSVELIAQALDRLSFTASLYGSRGKKIFEENKDPIVNAICFFEISLFADEVEMLPKLLRARLESLPEFDPEGWGLLLSGGQRPGITRA